jgi:arylsulfatase A-like enzyme
LVRVAALEQAAARSLAVMRDSSISIGQPALWIALGLVILFAAGCGSESTTTLGVVIDPVPKPRLVLLYAPCTVSKHYLSPYSADVEFTPHLEAFAREGVVFERHQSEAALSGIAYASIFSGTDATGHRVWTHPRMLTAEVYHIAEAFSDAGFETFFYDGHGMASAGLGYAQGVTALNSHKRELTGDDRYLEKIITRLKADPEYRAFVMTAFMVSHAPYSSDGLPEFCGAWPGRCPAGLEADGFQRYLEFYDEHNLNLSYDYPRTVEVLEKAGLSLQTLIAVIDALYASRIHHLDTLFGGVVKTLREAGLLDETLIAFTADHGEVLARETSEFRWNHGFGLAPEALGAPWIVRGAGLHPRRVEAVTRSFDVYPTLAGLAGLDLSDRPEVTGVDHSPVLRGESHSQPLDAFSQTSFIPKFNFPRTERWTSFRNYYPRSEMDLIWTALRIGDEFFVWRNLGDETFGAQAFDLASDPELRDDFFDSENPAHREAQRRLVEHKSLLQLGYAEDQKTGDLDVNPDDQTELLRALGYVP